LSIIRAYRTSDNTITINGLKEGETWRYSTDGTTFKLGIDRSFTLDDGTYAVNTIQKKLSLSSSPPSSPLLLATTTAATTMAATIPTFEAITSEKL
jgi:phage gp45-like